VNFIISLNADISNITLPVFTLQPLVENAIKYGIEPREEGGTVSILITSENDRIVIRIKDDGNGMSQNKLSDILTENENIGTDQSTGIGIANVMRRLKIAFQERALFSIKSNVEEGTSIMIILPGARNV